MKEMRKTIFHDGGEGKYKVFEIMRNESGEFYIKMSMGTKGDKESREYITMKLSEDEVAGLGAAINRMLLVE